MKTSVIVIALMVSTAALAQTSQPMVGDQPLVQIKPKGKAAKPHAKPAAQPTEAPDDASADAPAGAAPAEAAPARAAKGAKTAKGGAKPKGSVASQLQACLELEDGTKSRLDCYDAIYPPKPAKPPKAGAKPVAAKAVADCRLTKEEDERLACYNGFAEAIPKLPKS